jgi:hypothetical protein
MGLGEMPRLELETLPMVYYLISCPKKMLSNKYNLLFLGVNINFLMVGALLIRTVIVVSDPQAVHFETFKYHHLISFLTTIRFTPNPLTTKRLHLIGNQPPTLNLIYI